MGIFKKKEPPQPERPHRVGDGCKRCRNYNLEYCKGREACCEAFKEFNPNDNQQP